MPTKTLIKKTKKSPRQTKGLKPVKKTPKKITLDDLIKSQDLAWAAIRETEKAHEETEESFKKFQDETRKAIKDTQKNIGGLSNTLGSIVERILTPGLPEKFKKLGYNFNRIASYSYAAGVYAQIDGMLENGSQAVAVEVKTKLRQTDIDEHIERMDKIRKYADEHGDNRHFMGAMATFITDENAKNYALKKGLFIIEPSGEDVKVTKPETEPRVW
jgi:hypothetical protein